jgi:hypothetical protein
MLKKQKHFQTFCYKVKTNFLQISNYLILNPNKF